MQLECDVLIPEDHARSLGDRGWPVWCSDSDSTGYSDGGGGRGGVDNVYDVVDSEDEDDEIDIGAEFLGQVR